MLTAISKHTVIAHFNPFIHLSDDPVFKVILSLLSLVQLEIFNIHI